MPWPKWLGFGGKAKTPPKKQMDFDRLKRNADGTPCKPGDNLPQSRLGAFGSFAGAYALGAWGTPGGLLRGMLDKWMPSFSNRVVVRVQCAPRGNMNDAYMLALSAAFGATKDLVYASDNKISVTIDRTNKMVEVDLTYESSGLTAGGNILLGALIDTGKDIINAGVPETVEGGDWPSWLKRNRNPLNSQGSPELPLVGKPIATHIMATTSDPKFGANYTPYQDGMSRDNDLTAIIGAALLAGPCSSPAKPFLTQQPSPPGGKLVAVPTLGSYKPEDGGIDTNRWTQLALQGIAGAIPNWMPPNNYQTSGNG
jgi:hypothetical protein